MSRLDISDFKSSNPPSGTAIRPTMRPSSVVYWSRFGLAILSAFICFVLRLKGEVGIAVAFAIYVSSCFLFRYGLKYGDLELKGKQRALSLGSGTFIFVWAAVWMLLFTLSPY
jgi:hypothetical protein